MKNYFNRELIKHTAEVLHRHWPAFDRQGFEQLASDNLEQLELKQRSSQIEKALFRYLPDDFYQAAELLEATLQPVQPGDDISWLTLSEEGLAGWIIMPMAEYVAKAGQAYPERALKALHAMTMRSSSEFAIRHFLLAQPHSTLQTLHQWALDPNPHVRRLVSEGSRPRLPWAMQLPGFRKDPSQVLLLLEKLRDDESEYVRRSVANNLNDIAKDHPERVADIASDWLEGADRNRFRLVRHACRTLIKQGHPKVLSAFGFARPKRLNVTMNLGCTHLSLGETLPIELTMDNPLNQPQNLLVDYVVHHQKANGTRTPKVFKWKQLTLPPKASQTLTKTHAIKPITTRKYYPGEHRVEIQINGQVLIGAEFELVVEQEK